MSAPQLALVSNTAQSPGGRAIELMREARLAGEEQAEAFVATLELLVRQSREIIDGGEAYPAGVRDLCHKLAEDAGYRAQTIRSIMRSRAGAPTPFEAIAADRTAAKGDDPQVGDFPFSPAG